MKFSKTLHIVSILVGFAGVFSFVATLFGGTDDLVFGITKADALLCTMILFLIAIWAQIGAIHHMMLEKKGELI